MDSSGSSEDFLDTSLESSPSDTGGLEDHVHYHGPHRPSPFTLRSQCANGKCPMGTGILFRSRISPSPSKQRVWGRRRRRSDQSHLDNTTTSTISYQQDLSHDLSHLHDHSQHHHVHGHTQVYHVQAHYDHHHHQDDFIDSLTHATHPHPKEEYLNQANNVQQHESKTNLTLSAAQDQTNLTHSATTHTHQQTSQTHTTTTSHQDQTDHTTLTNHKYITTRDHARGHTLRSRSLEVSPDKPRPLQVGEMLRHRSRTPRAKKKAISTTPTTGQETGDRSDGGVSGGMASLATSVKKNVLEFLSPSKPDTSLPSIVESSESGFEEGTLFGGTVSTSTPSSDRFVGARQFFQERDTRERLTSDYHSPGDTPAKLRESTHRLSIRKQFNHYIAYSSDEELEDWQQQPKSHYTYSESLTYRERVTPDRKIGSPNMSRRGLRGASMKQDFSTSDLSTDESGHLNLRTRTIVRPMDALSDTSDGEEVAEESPVHMQRLRSSRSRSIDPTKLANGGSISRTHTTTTVTTTKTLHRGLDAESDVDDNTESAVPFRATPLTARSSTPLGRAPTPLGRAPTPLGRAPTPLGRAPTPLGHSSTQLRRSTTPVSSHLQYVSLNSAGGGYSLAKGAIAEDVEEEQAPKNKVVVWSRRTWQSITWVSTVITTSIVMMAARAVTARHHDNSNSTGDGAGKSTSFMSSLTLTTRRVTTTTTNLLTSTRERIRRNPLLLWIPLLLILLLLAFVAYWWLLQSRTKTDDTTTDSSDGTSFLTLVMTSVSELSLSVINGISQTAQSLALGMTSGLLVVWNTLLALGSWLLATCSSCLHTAWVAVTSMFMWLGNLVHAGLSHLLHFLYLILDILQNLAQTVLGFFSTSVSYMHGLFIPLAANNTSEAIVATQTTHPETLDSQTTHTETNDNSQETEIWSITGWVSEATSFTWATDVYKGLYDGATATKNWVWSGWMWLVLSAADVLTTLATFILWFLGSLWSLVCYLVSELWTVLAYIFTGIIGFFTSAATTMSSLAVTTSSAIVHYSSLIFLPFLTASEDSKVVVNPPSSSESRFVQHAKIQANNEDTSMYIQVHKGQLEHLEQKLETLGMKLIKLEESVVEGQDHHTQFQEQQASFKKNMDQLVFQYQDLKIRQDELVGEAKHCCKEAVVAVENIEQHLTKLLGDTFGMPREKTEGEAGGGSTPTDLAAWLKTYFVAKDELETRLTELKAAMQATVVKEEDKEMMMMMSEKAAEQTVQVVMDSVLERLKVELQKHQAIMTEHTQDQVGQQVKLQVEKAAIILSEEVTSQLDQKLLNNRQQLHESVTIAIKKSVLEHISTEVPEAVALAVSETVALEVSKVVETKLPDIVNIAVGSAVDAAVGGSVDAAVGVALDDALDAAVGTAVASAVSSAVNKAVNVAVTNIVTQVVPQAVADVVPQSIESALPDVVAVAVQEAVAAAVPEVVAAVLPEAVTTAVNNTVVSAVSEALLRVDVSKAGGITAKVRVDGEEGEVVMAGSSPGTVPTTVNISHNSSSSSNNGSGFFGVSTGLNRSEVMEIVKEALMKYDADKTGMVDHALESAGGNIISTRCTEAYQGHQAEVSILGFPIYRFSINNPRTVIQPDSLPGQCWAFKGSQGYIVIKLAGPVKPTGFTLEHIPRSLSPSGDIDSAPREFEVWGLMSENDEGVQLGVFEYSQYGEPLQYFSVLVANEEYFPLIELKINSNHGNLQYTCLYRFRVHGERLM